MQGRAFEHLGGRNCSLTAIGRITDRDVGARRWDVNVDALCPQLFCLSKGLLIVVLIVAFEQNPHRFRDNVVSARRLGLLKAIQLVGFHLLRSIAELYRALFVCFSTPDPRFRRIEAGIQGLIHIDLIERELSTGQFFCDIALVDLGNRYAVTATTSQTGHLLNNPVF